MADWKTTIQRNMVSASLCQTKQVKVVSLDKESGQQVFTAITTNYKNLGPTPEDTVKGTNYKDFRIKFKSKGDAEEFLENLHAIMNSPRNDSGTSGGNGSGTSGGSGSGTSGGSGSGTSVIPVEEGSNKTTIYIVVGIVVLLAALVGVVIWKKRK